LRAFGTGERERGDDGVEALALAGDHLVTALHRPDGRFQWAEARVLKRPAWRQDGLFANHSLTLDALDFTVGVVMIHSRETSWATSVPEFEMRT